MCGFVIKSLGPVLAESYTQTSCRRVCPEMQPIDANNFSILQRKQEDLVNQDELDPTSYVRATIAGKLGFSCMHHTGNQVISCQSSKKEQYLRYHVLMVNRMLSKSFWDIKCWI